MPLSSSALRNFLLDFITVQELDFLRNFSHSLESLKLAGNLSGVPGDYKVQNALSKSKRLFLVADLAHLAVLFTIVPESSLIFLILETNESTEEYGRHFINPLWVLINRCTHLKSVEFIDRFIAFDRLPDIVKLCEKKGITLKFSVWKDQLENDPELAISPQEEIKFRLPILMRCIKTGKVKLNELREEGNIEALREMFDNCKWLRAVDAERRD